MVASTFDPKRIRDDEVFLQRCTDLRKTLDAYLRPLAKVGAPPPAYSPAGVLGAQFSQETPELVEHWLNYFFDDDMGHREEAFREVLRLGRQNRDTCMAVSEFISFLEEDSCPFTLVLDRERVKALFEEVAAEQLVPPSRFAAPGQ